MTQVLYIFLLQFAIRIQCYIEKIIGVETIFTQKWLVIFTTGTKKWQVTELIKHDSLK